MLIKKSILKLTSSLVLLLFLLRSVDCQEDQSIRTVRVMFYNVENLFDTYDDSLKDDEEFLPLGLRRWNKTRYNKKINSLYKTIIAAGEWSPPAIVAFCEIENRKVLEDLIYETSLSRYPYGIIHEESPDERGIDVCFIFRKDIVHIIDHRSWIPKGEKREYFNSRSVLYAKCEILGDTIHLIMNHWPSRRGGVLAGETKRMSIAGMVRNAADSLYSKSCGQAKIVIMGDFNSDPDDPAIQTLINPGGPGMRSTDLSLTNLADKKSPGISGTYRYMGVWEMIDQIIVSNRLLNCNKGLFTNSGNFRIFASDFLLKNDSKYPGLTTYSTYRGYRYQGGISDHLPVLLDLGFR
jgi:endonuclease/exonuclease/phosphatase family metal-dependent hydrolase